MKNIFLFASMFVAAGLLLANVYTSLVDARSWGSDIPNSIATSREYFKTVSPGNFFRIFSPLNQVLGLLALILFWKSGSDIRLCLGIAFLLYVVGDVMTFAYFYPRNDFMFKDAALTDVEGLTKVWSEWSAMNWVRSLVLLAGLALSALSMHKIYSTSV
jgi:hypothetical protein